jgi:hypothetical protein
MHDLISGDLRKVVDHPYLFTGCQFFISSKVDLKGNYTRANENWMDLSDREILETYSTPGDRFVYGERGYVDHSEFSHWPCSVLRAEGKEGRYTVRIHKSPLRGLKVTEIPWDDNDVPRILTNYSQDSIHYFVNPSAIDQNLPNVFREPIGLPDNLFPKQWKNL